MERKKVRETLEKQLELLSERSTGTKERDYTELAELTKAMCLVAETITRVSPLGS